MIRFIVGTLIIAVILIAESCFGSGCTKKPISPESRKFLKAYENVDTLIFESNLGREDTFVLDLFTDDYTQCNKFEIGPDQFNSVGVRFKSLSSHQREKYRRYLDVDLFTDWNGPETKIEFSLFDGSANLLQGKDSTVISPIMTSSHPLPTKFFDYVSPAWDGSFMKSFHWNMEFGIVQYSSLYGETFVLTYRG